MKIQLHIRLKALVFALALSSLSFVYGQAAAYGFVEGENYEKDVVYKTADGRDLLLDIFYPDEELFPSDRPWAVYIHGGGWAGGERDNIFGSSVVTTLQHLVDSGVVCVSVQYRLASSSESAPATSFNSVVDCKDAARFLLKNAEKYKLDEDKYAIWGSSAGGHLSLVSALTSDTYFPGDADLADIHPKYTCVASFFPFTSCLNEDLRPGSIFEDGTLFERLLGGSVEEEPELAGWLSPAEFIGENTTPILLLHGDKDATLPIINSYYMMEVAEIVNADVELLVVENGGHSFSGNNISPSFDEIGDSCANYILAKFNEVDDYGLIEAEGFTSMSGVEVTNTTDEGEGEKVSGIDAEDWMEYEMTTSASGTYSFEYRIAATVDAAFLVVLDDEVVDTVSFTATGGDEVWETVYSGTPIYFTEGVNTIRLISSQAGWNLNWMKASDECYETNITPRVHSVNLLGVESDIMYESELNVYPGFSVILSPLPALGGNWTWTGPNAFTDSTSEVILADIQKDEAGIYVGTFTNECGQQSVQEFIVGVQDSIRIEAEDYTLMSGVLTEATTDVDGGNNISEIDNGDWLEFELNVPLSALYVIDYRVASVATGGSFTIESDGKTIDNVSFDSTGGAQVWETVSSSSSVFLQEGIHTIRISSTMDEWSLNWFELVVDEMVAACSLPFTTDYKVVEGENFYWTSGAIDITCVESVSLSATLMSFGASFTDSDYLNYYYKLDNGDLVAIAEYVDAFGTATVSVEDLSGDVIEIIVEGYTSSALVKYYVMDILLEVGSVVTTKLEAEDYDAIISGTSIVTEDCSDEGLGSQLGYVTAGDWCMFKDIDLTNLRTVTARIASKSDAGNIEVRLGSETGTLIGTIAVESTGSWTSYASYITDIAEVSGVEDVYFVFSAGFNINWFELYTSATIPDPSAIDEAINPVSALELYPNPVSDVLNVANVAGARLEIYNTCGQVVIVNDIFSDMQTVTLTDLNAGIYIVMINNNNVITTRKIIKQ